MDIKILDSWLREHLHTEAKASEIARALSLTSASIERIEPYQENDCIYHIEVTTNRPDMASVVGLAREAAAILPRFEIPATFLPLTPSKPKLPIKQKETMTIHNNDRLVRRICGVILEVTIGESPQFMQVRLIASGTRTLNNVIDITNYVMHEMGHPTHAFDYDRLTTKQFVIRESKKGEHIVTLDKKMHTLLGGDIVADDGTGTIVDLLGVMGTENSVVTDKTKRILFFIDNNDPQRIRKTSMSLAIRTEAAGLNEKDVDPELALPVLLRGIELYQQYAKGIVISDIIDIYPRPVKKKVIQVSKEKITKIVGIAIPAKQSVIMLTALGFEANETLKTIEVSVPTWRNKDVDAEEDIIEEIARVFGYHNIPTALPGFTIATPFNQDTNIFFWEDRVKDTMKYWGFSETYTYSMVSEALFEGPLEQAVTLANPLDAEHLYMRRTLTPSLYEVSQENSGQEDIKIFEIANVYKRKPGNLPDEILTLCALWKKAGITFYHMKGIIESLAADCGIQNILFKDIAQRTIGAQIYIGKEYLGRIDILEPNIISCELNFLVLKKHATLRKVYVPILKFPPLIEDLSLIIDPSIKTGSIIEEIKKQSDIIQQVILFDQFEQTRTFHIIYQDKSKNLTTEDVSVIRNKMNHALSQKFHAVLK